ncbi:hypothetical protein KI387_002060, partial [Taxus chinensis]
MAFPSNEVSEAIQTQEIPELLKFHEDRYDGVVVEIQNENENNDAARFASSLKASLSQWTRQGKKGAWIKVAIEQAKILPALIQEGFWYHHAEASYVMLVYWIPTQSLPCTIPANASNQVGIAAFVFNAQGEVLVVQEKYGPYKDSGLWKMPTGRVEQGECINKGAVREVKEETGIETEFVEVVGFRDGHNAAFGKSDLLFVCMLKSLSSEILMEDTEICAAKWMAMEEFVAQPKNQQSKVLKDMVDVCVARITENQEDDTSVVLQAWAPSMAASPHGSPPPAQAHIGSDTNDSRRQNIFIQCAVHSSSKGHGGSRIGAPPISSSMSGHGAVVSGGGDSISRGRGNMVILMLQQILKPLVMGSLGRYDGVIFEIQNENENNDAAHFASSLKASLSQWTRQGKNGVWIKVAIEQAKILPALIQVLVVQEKYGPYKDSRLWKMPTGRVEQGECINKGAVREVKEKRGDGHNAAFGKSDLLFVCMLKSLSSEILKEDTEICAAK